MTPPNLPPISSDQLFPRWEKFLRFAWLGAALLLAGFGYLYWKRSRPAAYVPDVHFAPATQWTNDPGVSITPVFSHDGKLVAYSSDRGGSGNLAIWLRPYPSGEPRRLTNDSFNQTDPDFSPDGLQVVYHSDRDGGGIYLSWTTGADQPRLLVKGGVRPRFSPDGRWIAYYTLSNEGPDTASYGAGRIYVVSPLDAQPRQVRPEFAYASHPVWSPDGERLLFEGVDSSGTRDWWITKVEGGEPTRTHAFERLNPRVGAHLGPERWIGDKILFPAAPQANLHLWELAITPVNWQTSGLPRQITGGDWIEQAPSIGPDGRTLFTRMRVSLDLWSLPLGDHGSAPAKLQRLSDDHALNQAPMLSADGSRMVYLSNKSGMRDVRVRDLKTGTDEVITTFQNVGYRPALSADGTKVAYRTTINNRCMVVVQSLGDARSRAVVPGCFNIWDWSPDEAALLAYNPRQAPVSADLVTVATGERRTLVSSPEKNVLDASVSPDGRWLVFSAGANMNDADIYVARVDSRPVGESGWTRITRGGGSLAAWSRDGETIYFHSQRDGFHCLWAQSVDSNKRATSNPYAIQHFHNVAFGMYMIKPQDFRMSAGRDRLVLNLATESANLWLMKGWE